MEMQLNETERDVRLYWNQRLEEERVAALRQRLAKSGFKVRAVERVDIAEPILSTEIGRFVGFRSIVGFLDGYLLLFRIAREKARRLTDEN